MSLGKIRIPSIDASALKGNPMKTIGHHIALSLAIEEMNALARKNGSQFATAKEQAREIKAGWIFLFNSVELMESGDIL